VGKSLAKNIYLSFYKFILLTTLFLKVFLKCGL
jgi:hypothetical protein